jgi:rare lipoprotein A
MRGSASLATACVVVLCSTFIPLSNSAEAQVGLASYYKHGRKTANGEKFNPNGLTAAHRSLRFGTKVRVTHLKSGKSVIVRINDRGPFIRGRIIDLSYGAARAVGLHRSGTAKVKISVVN